MIRRIRNDGELYLTRIYLFASPWFTLYLHIFHKPDVARDLHNHPWNWCWTVALWGGYVEHLVSSRWSYPREVTRYAMLPRRFAGAAYHTIASLTRSPTVTLFAHGRTVREWGFLKDGENVPWHRYLVDEGFNTKDEIDTIRGRYNE